MPGGVDRDRSIFLAHLFFSQVIQAQISHNAIDPGVEGAFKPKTPHVLIRFQERFLVNVLSVGLRSGEVESQPEHRLIIVTDQFLEGSAIPALRLSDQHRVIYAA